MSTIIFIGVLIAITYALTSSSQKDKPKRTRTPMDEFREAARPASGKLIDKGGMLRCHNCGAFFPESRAVISRVQDLELHFCSQNCKINFRVD